MSGAEQRREAADRMIDARRNGGSAEIAATREEFAATQARLEEVRVSAVGLVQQVSGDNTYTDGNYVFPTFVTSRLPIGLVGLLIAAVFAAAMSSIAAELRRAIAPFMAPPGKKSFGMSCSSFVQTASFTSQTA